MCASIVSCGIEDTGPRFVSLPPLDDATGKVANALLRVEEDTRGHLLLMAGIIRLFGIPLAIYGERHRVLRLHDQARQCSPTGGLNPWPGADP